MVYSLWAMVYSLESVAGARRQGCPPPPRRTVPEPGLITVVRCASSFSDPPPREVRGVGWEVHLTDRHPHSQARYQKRGPGVRGWLMSSATVPAMHDSRPGSHRGAWWLS